MSIAAFLVVAALAIGWVLQGSQVEPLSPPSADEPVQDAYVEGFVSVQMDDRGRPQRRLEAESLVHYQDGRSRLAQPRYRFRDPDGDGIWWARSDRGWILPLDESTSATVDGDGDDRIVRLAGGVNIWREEDPKVDGADFDVFAHGESDRERAIDIVVDELEIRPATGYAGSDAFVTIRTPGSRTQGKGLRVWLNEGKFTLLSRVSTRIDELDRTL
ncbi:LPS export ABC transporter periplasmic protein LptC [Thioalkalivibrio sp. HK1]|uniref:LPS export ABC transporter periplasmic protein LptC n=1 Tax=Thioalkalivibrio sp. HK1 TaxID=1469245 RepID=UPI00046F3D7D|nr:LPS export ABC transporter periplasmic protein LptC [Thioalkalivibrio sp. HK1]